MKHYGKLDLRNMDCMELMREYPDNHFDLAITSPPYNMNLRVRNGKYCSRQIVKELSSKYENYSDNLPMDEYRKFTVNVLTELIRISGLVFYNVQMVTGNKPALFSAVGELSDYLKEVVIWDKCTAEPSIAKGCMNSQFEFIFIFSQNSKTRAFNSPEFEKGTLSNVWNIPKSRGVGMNHRAAFPDTLPKIILKNFGRAGQSVFDPFLGSGTTAIASYYAGCNCTGSEIDADYYKAMMERIERETAQQELF